MRLIEIVVHRLLRGVLVLFGISVLVTLIFFATPGSDPASRLAGRGAPPETLARVRVEYGFDRALPVRYAILMRRLLWTRDLPSFVNRGQLVVPAVLKALPTTIALAAGAAVLFVSAGVAIGILGARAGPRTGNLVVALGLLGVSIPAFWLGSMLSWIAQDVLHGSLFAWVPPLGQTAADAGSWLRTMALPWFTLAVLYAGIYGRVLRAGLRDALARDYVRTARAKGLGDARVMFVHALPNAAVPALALLGLDLGALLGGGTMIVEVVFGLPGLGRLTYDALRSLDLATVMACVLYAAAVVVVVNALSDVAQGLLDPGRRT